MDSLDGLPGIDFLIDTSDFWQRKAEALRAHRSQHLGTEKHFLKKPDEERLMRLEVFRQAYGPPLSRRPASDLFDSVMT